MKSKLGKSALLLAFVAVSACTNPNGVGGGLFGGGAGANTGAFEPGSASDPTSPAYFQQTIGDRVLFEVDQSTLTDQGRAVLTAQADWLITNADYMAIIEGHADEQGTREYNLALGARRANAVKEFLVSQGIANNRLKTVTFGKERPIEICSAEACYSQNRRAVTVISAGLLS
ncbi:peptidoglycan-associated lipoprotein Pal [Cognatishimia activa]|uniref:peptidoglycan-associated lipoprotein Pal n=1 Tax=Cognatishimia activa TaxID=1715691 RepID=UPI0022317DC6|nr:peptidoglycan-associated lipoprotein Pal [Cognatishimia activa]UZD89662.1 peptidoglycan-associated lipoprotein Pal [Cognatishimia activa]